MLAVPAFSGNVSGWDPYSVVGWLRTSSSWIESSDELVDSCITTTST